MLELTAGVAPCGVDARVFSPQCTAVADLHWALCKKKEANLRGLEDVADEYLTADIRGCATRRRETVRLADAYAVCIYSKHSLNTRYNDEDKETLTLRLRGRSGC
jgi:hypothetical protein